MDINNKKWNIATVNVILYKSAIAIITSYILLLRNITRYQYIMYLASQLLLK